MRDAEWSVAVGQFYSSILPLQTLHADLHDLVSKPRLPNDCRSLSDVEDAKFDRHEVFHEVQVNLGFFRCEEDMIYAMQHATL